MFAPQVGSSSCGRPLAGSPLARDMPALPSPTTSDAGFLAALRKLAGRWPQVNAAMPSGTLILPGGFGLAQLRADDDAPENLLANLAGKVKAARAARGTRDVMTRAPIRRMVQYRNAAPAALLEHPRRARDIPRIYLRRCAPPDATGYAMSGQPNPQTTGAPPGLGAPMQCAQGHGPRAVLCVGGVGGEAAHPAHPRWHRA